MLATIQEWPLLGEAPFSPLIDGVFKQTEADKFLVHLHRDQNVYVDSTGRTQLSPDRLSRDSDVIQITEDDATNL